MNKSNLMSKAHKIAKELVGDYSVRLSIALKMVWAEIKKGVKKMVELVGTEKQIAWAEDIRSNYLETLERIIEGVKAEDIKSIKLIWRECKEEISSKIKDKTTPEVAKAALEIIMEIKNKIENTDSAKKFIEVYNSHRYFAPHEINTINILGQFR